MGKKIYIVTAYRWGERENHSYPLGVFTKKSKAIKCADEHTEYRGRKYGCFVEKCIIDSFDNSQDSYTETIYKTKAAMGNYETK